MNHSLTIIPSDSLDIQTKKNYFLNERSSIVNFIGVIDTHIAAGKRIIGIDAGVKCGKKEMAQCVSLFYPNAAHFYVTALNRKDVKKQQGELASYGIQVRVIDAAAADVINGSILSITRTGRRVILILDEDDYGSGDRQNMSKLWVRVIDNKGVTIITTSASGEEGAFSGASKRPDYIRLSYTPPDTYRSAKHFLDEGLVHAPAPAFEKNSSGKIIWTEHGIDVVTKHITAGRRMGVFRVCAAGLTMPAFKNAAERLQSEITALKIVGDMPCIMKVIDQSDSFDWEEETTRLGHIYTNKMYIFVLKQTCTRGTDLKGWHPYLAFWHDNRPKKKSPLNTLIQAFLRPTYYTSMYTADNQPAINMYVDRDVLQYVVDRDIAAYLSNKGKPPMRTRVSKTSHHYDEQFFPVTTEEAAVWGNDDDDTVRTRIMGQVKEYLATRNVHPDHPDNADLFRTRVNNKRFEDIHTLFSWGKAENGDYFSRAFDGHDEPLYLKNGHTPAISPEHSAVRLYECYNGEEALGLILYFWNGKPSTNSVSLTTDKKSMY